MPDDRPADDDWGEEVEEVAVERKGPVARPDPQPSVEFSRDQRFVTFARHLVATLRNVPMYVVSDGVTTHMITLCSLFRVDGTLRVLYEDTAAPGTFLQEGRNAAGVRAVRYFHSDWSNVWSVTVDELSRVAVIQPVFGGRDSASESQPQWYIGHHGHGDRAVAHVYGPACSFQLTLDVGRVAAKEHHGTIRWDVFRGGDGYSLLVRAARVAAEGLNLPDAALVAEVLGAQLRAFQSNNPRLAETLQHNELDLFTGRYAALVALDGVPDPDGSRPGSGVHPVTGWSADVPERFDIAPIDVSEDLVYGATVSRPYVLTFALRGHGTTWTRAQLLERTERILLSLVTESSE